MSTRFPISLAEWSFNQSLFAGKMNHLDFPVRAKKEFNIDAVEYVNQFFMDKAGNKNYLKDMRTRCEDLGVKSHLIMCDDEGALADSNHQKRQEAVENHYKWIEAAYYLGCSMIRVNTFGDGNYEELQKAAVDGLTRLGSFAVQAGIAIVVENHGGFTSDGTWLAGLMKRVGQPHIGLLPDFGNFCLKREGKQTGGGKCNEWYDRYKGVAEMMPYAKSISAKSQNFDENGNCTETDYAKMLQIVESSGFSGFLGIEYGGKNIPEEKAIRHTKNLIEKTLASLDKSSVDKQ